MADDQKRVAARRQRAEMMFKRQEEGAQALLEYEAKGQAVRAKTARLKAQRLAREDQDNAARGTIKRARRPFTETATARAAVMASREIDRLGDRTATEEDRASRKRRLIKGPKEFRDIRDDQPK